MHMRETYRFIVSRRDGNEANLTRYLRIAPSPQAGIRWTTNRPNALRLSRAAATGAAAWWNAKPAVQRLGITARVEDADPPPSVSGEAA